MKFTLARVLLIISVFSILLFITTKLPYEVLHGFGYVTLHWLIGWPSDPGHLQDGPLGLFCVGSAMGIILLGFIVVQLIKFFSFLWDKTTLQ